MSNVPLLEIYLSYQIKFKKYVTMHSDSESHKTDPKLKKITLVSSIYKL